nr:type VI secretion system tube protein Hcp [uncultured Cupriavidus sp.]
MDIFLKLTNIKGESRDEKHKDEISVLGWGWSMNQPTNMHMDGGGGAGKAWVGDLTFQHYVDRASPTLMLKCLTGEHIKEGVLVIRKAGGAEALEYLKIKMTDVMVSSVSPYGEGAESMAMETVALSFSEVDVEYTEQTETGGAGARVATGYSMKTNKPK